MLCAVTGANGFLGSHLVDRLLGDGHRVRVLVRPTADRRWLAGKEVETVTGDLFDREATDALCRDARWVFHAAGAISAHRQRPYFAINVDGSMAVARSAQRAAPTLKRFVFVSSQSVCGPSRDGAPLTERTDARPVNLYGESKLAAERALSELELPLTVVRPGPIYGPRDRNTLPFFQLARFGLRLKLGFGRRLSNFAHVEDVVAGMVACAEHRAAEGGVFLLGGPDNMEFDDIGRAVVQAVRGKDGRVVFVPRWLAYTAGAVGGGVGRLLSTPPGLNLDRIRMLVQPNWSMDLSHIGETVGFEPTIPLPDGALQTANWYREQGWI